MSIDCNFAMDLSSYKLKNNNNNWGATLLSAMFMHCTSVPIWIDELKGIHLIGPDDMYNFAWGSDGGPADSKKK